MQLTNIIQLINSAFDRLNATSLKRLAIYALLAYPIVVMYFYQTEIKLLLLPTSQSLKIENIANVQERCYQLRQHHQAEAVILYLYQPAGKNKTYKERIVFSTGNVYTPLPSMKIMQLFSASSILADLREDDLSIITKTSKHQYSPILSDSRLSKAYVTPIRDKDNNELVGEILWVFKNDIPINTNELISESQIFAYDII